MPNLRDPRINLGAGELATFAGLRALGHLDLQLVRVREVEARDAEPAGRDLLDGGVFRIALVVGPSVARGVLAAFAGVALAADAVHRDCQRLVRLTGDGAVAHRAGLEALHDGRDGLDFLDGNRSRRLELQQAAQRVDIFELGVHQRAVFLEGLVIRVADGLLELVDGLRVEEVQLPIRAPLILATNV